MLFATALTDDSMADNFADPARRPLWVALVREVMAVAGAQSPPVAPRGFNGFEPQAFSPEAGEAAANASIAALAAFNRNNAKTHSGGYGVTWQYANAKPRSTPNSG